MHAVLLTLIIVTGADQPAAAPMATPGPYAMPGDGACATCEGEASGPVGYVGGCVRGAWQHVADWWGPMPQTCYDPRFGCYPGNPRTIQRYPAFHGYYYRQPYNYRHYFDYPWHAQPFEPMGYFTYQPGAPAGTLTPIPAGPDQQPIPAPPVPADLSRGQWRPMKTARTVGN